ncbi:MAG: NAD(P)H-flavin oxidoreductase [Aquificota bacterium]|nr:MAG: NAD(P)H-flavin oxidoreductase [Aquificota bacterium]
MAVWAPSGMNRQNWFFVVVAGDLRDRVVEICYQGYLSYIGKKVEKVFSHKPHVVRETRSFFATLGGAPVVIFAYAEPGPESIFTDVQSVSAVIQNMLLLAHERGLGTCWMTGPLNMEEEFNKLLGVDGKKLVALITVGYSDEVPKVPPRRGKKVVYKGFPEDGES